MEEIVQRRYEYVIKNGLLYRLTRAQWKDFCSASIIEDQRIEDFGVALGAFRNADTWELKYFGAPK